MHYLISPWRHQLEAIDLARDRDNFALFHDMGVGKSATTINILREHYSREKRIMRTLILCPLIVVRNWQDEFKLHSKIAASEIIQLAGSGKKRVKTFMEAALDTEKQTLTRARIFITNYESVENADLLKLYCDWQPEILILDESHRVKSTKSVRAKAVVELLGEMPMVGASPPQYVRSVKHVYLLTGTPILNSPMDIFQQYRIMDSGKTFGLNFYEFRGRYFQDENAGMPSHIHFPRWVPRPETYDQLHKKIYQSAHRVLKKDCLDLPPLVRQKVYVELSPEQRRLYDEMKRDYVTWVETPHREPRAVVAQMALTKALRLQQIVSGFVKVEDGTEIPIKKNPRLDAVDGLLADLANEHKLVIWATFKENYRRLADVCRGRKIDYEQIHGDINATDKNKAVHRFRNDPACRVIIANQAAGGVGINLVENPNIVHGPRSAYSIFYSKNFSLEQDLQAESRNYRGGSEVYTHVTRLDLVAGGTIDELISEALAEKQNIAERILDWGTKL